MPTRRTTATGVLLVSLALGWAVPTPVRLGRLCQWNDAGRRRCAAPAPPSPAPGPAPEEPEPPPAPLEEPADPAPLRVEKPPPS